MARKRPTWEIEYEVEPSGKSLSGYNRTITERMLAATHDEAVALLREYDPDFVPGRIIASRRCGMHFIVPEGQP